MLVFVYGTLKKGFYYHNLLGKSKFVGTTLTPPIFKMLDCGAYPCLIRGDKQIRGEVYSINDETLKRLDKLESVPSLYTRETIDTEFGPCYVYVYSRKIEGLREIQEWTCKN